MDKKVKILVTGACGQIGTELVKCLRERYGMDQVMASDILDLSPLEYPGGPYARLNVLDKTELDRLVCRQGITRIFHLAAYLSAKGEGNPLAAWELNVSGLLNVLETARLNGVEKVFWPSSIAVFGPGSHKAACPQHTFTDPVTAYGISKSAGEQWCHYYHHRYGLDVRSLRFPGLISHSAPAGGGTTDYAVGIFQQAFENHRYACYLRENTRLPMLYMPDAIRAVRELMDAPAESISVRTSYNIAGMSFTPGELAAQIARHVPGLSVSYAPDFRQQIADSWPSSVDDRHARNDWGWQPAWDLEAMTADMLKQIRLAKQHLE